jgi:hypothetical protein
MGNWSDRLQEAFIKGGLEYIAVKAIAAVATLAFYLWGRHAEIDPFYLILLLGVFLTTLLLLLWAGVAAFLRAYRQERISSATFWSVIRDALLVLVMLFLLGEIHSLRSDFERYAMPRQLEPWQEEKIKDGLSGRTYDDLEFDYPTNDLEASSYCSQLLSVFSQSGWQVKGCVPVDTQQVGASISFQNVAGALVKPDLKHPPTAALLERALTQAQVVYSSNGDAYQPLNAVRINVGRRPFEIMHPSWIEKLRMDFQG